MPSLRARLLFDLVMPLLGMKRRYLPPLSADILIQRRRKACKPPREALGAHFQGRPVYRLAPAVLRTRTPLLYLHGGAFVHPITPYHWRLIRQLVRDTGAVCDVPLYPLAPEHTIDQQIDFVENFWAQHAHSAPPIILADSAGALLALRLAQRLRDAGQPTPAALVLLSPCLDLTFSDPRAQALDDMDPMLSLKGLPEVCRIAAGPRAADDPAINPLMSGLVHLPPMLVFGAGRDVLWPDAVRLAEGVLAGGGVAELVQAADMAHVWPVMPIPEAVAARARIVTFINQHAAPLITAS